MRIDFDLELAKEAQELGEGKIITRKGEEIHIIDWDCCCGLFKIDGCRISDIYNPSLRYYTIMSWSEEGKYCPHEGSEHDNDLFIEVNL